MTKGTKIYIAIAAAFVLIVAAFSGGFIAGMVINNLKGGDLTLNTPLLSETGQSTTTADATNADSSLKDLFKPFWQTWSLVHEIFVDQPVDDTTLMRGAIKGMLDSLGDKHTGYIEPELLQQENAQLEGEYDGIGAYVDTTGEFLIITSPMPESPAEKAGLKTGDKVIKIDGEDMTGKNGQYALTKVLGPKGTEVTLTILREGLEEPFDVTIVRAKIEVPSVTYKMLENNIGYVSTLR